jgi:dTDP-4-dehydrorhamnose reductase
LVSLNRKSHPDPADLSRPGALSATVQKVRPDVIVNAAAYTAVDKAESERELARAINTEAPATLARDAADLGAWLVSYSTDYVFDGSGDAPRDEAAATGPLNVYGATKLEGEERIRASGCRHLILRTSWVYAARGSNFVKTILRLAAERDTLQVVNDQVGAPTGADLLADVTAHALRCAFADASLTGTYHVAAAGETSWWAYARFVIDIAQAAGVPLRTAAEAVEAVPSTAFPTPARRPLNSRLDTRLFRERFRLVLPAWQYGVQRMLHEILERQ